MQVHFINVGYGEAILVEKDGYVVLVDGGTKRKEEYDNPGCIRAADYLKKIGISSIDLVIITHIHDDHIGGIPDVIRNCIVSEVWINVRPDLPDMTLIDQFESIKNGNLSGKLFRNALESYSELLVECGRRGIPVLQKGGEDGVFSPREDFLIELLAPAKEVQTDTADAFLELFASERIDQAEAMFYAIDKSGNSTSIALRIRAGKVSILLSGDKVDGWDEIYERYGSTLKSQILKLTHHGQVDGMPRAMVEACCPEYFVICSSIDRRYNSAHPEIIGRALAYLEDAAKDGGVFVTGCLGCESKIEPEEKKEICALQFLCDEKTGEIAVRYAVK